MDIRGCRYAAIGTAVDINQGVLPVIRGRPRVRVAYIVHRLLCVLIDLLVAVDVAIWLHYLLRKPHHDIRIRHLHTPNPRIHF